jgi:hypothetical protein
VDRYTHALGFEALGPGRPLFFSVRVLGNPQLLQYSTSYTSSAVQMRQNALPAFIQYVRDNFCNNRSVLSFKIGVAGGNDACTAGKGRSTTGSFFPYQPSHGKLVFKPDGYMYQFDILTVLTAQITNVHVLGDLEGALISAFSSGGKYSTKKCLNNRPGGDTVTRPGFVYVVARYKPGRAPAVTQAGTEPPAEPPAERPAKKAKLDKKTILEQSLQDLQAIETREIQRMRGMVGGPADSRGGRCQD